MAGQFKASRFPIYMDDADLFSKSGMGPKRHPPFNEEIFLQMFMKLGRLWWSRLVIATRGYAITDFKGSDQIVFPCDDAFVYIHQRLVETGMDMGLQLLRDIEILEATGSDALRALFEGKDIANNQNPFFLPNKQNTFRRLFGEPSSQTYRTAFMRGFCYLMFFNIFTKLQKRWIEQATALSAGNPTCIEIIGQQLEPFQDPDWRPDERVVIYHQFGFGQKAWVLTDFDRYIIKYWKPNGVRVIFGYEYVESKLADGFRICRQCGILESHVEQFKRCLVCLKQKIEDVACYCSEDCEDLNRSAHVKQHQANPKVTFNI